VRLALNVPLSGQLLTLRDSAVAPTTVRDFRAASTKSPGDALPILQSKGHAMNRTPDWSLSTLLLNADRTLEDGNSIAPPIHQSTPFRIRDTRHLEEISVPMGDRYYTRRGNPTSSRLAKVIADLEGAETGMITSSGMGAMATAVLSLVRAGDHVIGQKAHYIGTNQILDTFLSRYGIETTRVDQRMPEAFSDAIRPNTKLILLETPVNPMMYITDLPRVCKIAKQHGAITICDNTFATPINQQPISLGVDVVMHSVTKYIGGHHDLLAGALVGRKELIEEIWDGSLTLGAIGAPFNSWLALRGIRTLELRLARQNTNGQALAEMLSGHPSVERVFFPGLQDHPQHNLARSQMSGFGGLVTFEVFGGHKAAVSFLEKLILVGFHSSLGGVNSNAIRPAALFGEQLPADVVAQQGITPGLIRLAAGIENTKDLIEDVRQALGG
jgi:cystathionine beta-lyase/cystathionine gamma-synthase